MSRHIDPRDFADLRKQSGLTRRAAAAALDVTGRTIQNWETGGARIPWMAYRMLRILTGCALPGNAWEGWTIHGDRLIAPNGRWFDAASMEQIERVFALARLWRQDYARRQHRPAAVVLALPRTWRISTSVCSSTDRRSRMSEQSKTSLQENIHQPMRASAKPKRGTWRERTVDEGSVFVQGNYVPVSFVAKDWNVTPRRIRSLLAADRLQGRREANGYWEVAYPYRFTIGTRGPVLKRQQKPKRGRPKAAGSAE